MVQHSLVAMLEFHHQGKISLEKIAEKANVTQKKAEHLVNVIFDSMVEALAKNERIEIRGFGSFVTKAYKSYTGRNFRGTMRRSLVSSAL